MQTAFEYFAAANVEMLRAYVSNHSQLLMESMDCCCLFLYKYLVLTNPLPSEICLLYMYLELQHDDATHFGSKCTKQDTRMYQEIAERDPDPVCLAK